mgnify:CR=1 FL=1
MKPALVFALVAAAVTPGVQAQDSGQLNVICSVQAEWCNMIQTVFAKTTGVKVNMSLKGSGEALAQLIAERANPKTDVWFGGSSETLATSPSKSARVTALRKNRRRVECDLSRSENREPMSPPQRSSR